MDLAIVMKAVLVASYFTALSLQVEHFLHPTKNLTRWTLEVRPRAMSTWTRRRLTQGQTRRKGWTTATGWWEARSAAPGSAENDQERNILSGYFLSWWAGTSTDSQTRYLVVVRFKGILIRSFFFGSVFIQNLGVNQLFARDLMVVLVQDVQ